MRNNERTIYKLFRLILYIAIDIDSIIGFVCLIDLIDLFCFVFWLVSKGSYSLACGKVMPVNEGDKVSVYISHPVPWR